MADLTQTPDTVLRLIKEERAFRSDFSAAADSIVDKVYSYYANTSCTCKGAIVDWISKNTDTVNALLTKHKDAVVAMGADVAKAAALASPPGPSVPAATPGNPGPHGPAAMLNNPKAKFGTVIDIERDPDAYKALIHGAMREGWVYRGCTIVPDVVDGKAVWSVFFF
jgi:hypothetical protein